jgi:hypothetical protein
MAEEVEIRREIIINAPQQKVFDFVSNYHNDSQWRSEVDRFEMDGPLETGVRVTEYASFEGTEIITPSIVTERTSPVRSVCETPADHANHLLSVRVVEPVTADTSNFIYELTFDRDTMKSVMAEVPPTPAVTAWYGAQVDTYLATLKGILEAS